MIQVTPFDSALFNPLLSDNEAGSYLNDQAFIKAMLSVESALAIAQAKAGLIPAEAATAITVVAENLEISPATLAQGTASAGVPVPALVAAIKAQLPPEQAKWVHFGATSQDIVDTALILTIRSLLDIIEQRIKYSLRHLRDLAQTHENTLIAGRTRTQQAVPMSFGFKVAEWANPLLRQLARLDEMRPRILKTQLGGAVGTLAAMGEKADEVGLHFADTLTLERGDNWHTQRDSLVECSSWLSVTTGLLGKMAQDWLWLSSTECGEIRFTNGGGSSTMPQKCNPVNAEVMVAMMRLNAGWCGQMHQAMLHEHERSGSQWTQEWFILPQQLLATVVAARHSIDALDHIVINREQMLHNLGAFNGVIYAEAATFELAKTMGRDKASELVKAASKTAITGTEHLFTLIAQESGQQLDVEAMQAALLKAGATTPWLARIIGSINQICP